MPVVARMHRSHDTNVVDDACRVGQKFRDLGTALAMCGEFPGAAEQLLAGPIDETVRDLSAIILTVMFCQFGFGVKQIHVSRSAVHEHGNHGCRLRS